MKKTPFLSKGNLLAILTCLLVIGVGYAFLGSTEDKRADMLTEPVSYKAQDATVEVGVVPESQEMLISAEKAPEPEPTEEPMEEAPEASETPYAPTEDTLPAEDYEALPEEEPMEFPEEEAYEEIPAEEYAEEPMETEEAPEEEVDPDAAKREEIISWAKEGVRLEAPYVFGGTTPDGWDCSGYTSWVYSKVGIDLPRSSGAQVDKDKSGAVEISESDAKPGDLVYHPGHIGIYAGPGMFYDAGSPGSNTSYRPYAWMNNGPDKVQFFRVL